MDGNKKYTLTYLSTFYGFIVSIITYAVLFKFFPFPKIKPDINLLVPLLRSYVYPQSHKTMAYFLSILMIPALSFLLSLIFGKILRKLQNKTLVLLGLSILSVYIIFLSLTSISVFGLISLFNTYSLILPPDPFILTWPFYLTLLLGMVVLTVIYFNKKKLIIFSHRSLVNFLITFIGIILSLVTVFDRKITPPDIFAPNNFQYFHTAVFIAPIMDILSGKTILIDSASLYGLFIVYFPSLIFKYFLPLSFTNFFYLMMIYALIYYLIGFFILKERLQSQWLALIGLTVFFTYNFYLGVDRYIRPQYFPIRYILDMPFFFMLLFFSKSRFRFADYILAFTTAVAFFYNYETGGALVVSLCAFYLIKSIIDKSKESLFLSIRYLGSRLLLILGNIFFLGLFYSFLAYIKSGRLTEWFGGFKYLSLFGRGYLGSDGPLVSFYILVILIYLISLTKIYVSLFTKKYWEKMAWDTALTIYGIAIFYNYVVRSYLPNLAVVSIPAIILGLIFFKEILTKLTLFKNRSNFYLERILLFGPYISLGGLIIFALVFYLVRLTVNPHYNYWGREKKTSEKLFNQLLISSEAVRNYSSYNEKEVTLISYFDTFIALNSGKRNDLPYSTSLNLASQDQLEEVSRFISYKKPRYIFADKDDWVKSIIYKDIYDYIEKNYRLIDTKGVLNVWEKIASS